MHLYTPVPPVASSDALDPLDKLPAGFDPIANPIVSLHFFGVDPLRPVAPLAGTFARNPKWQHRIEPVRQSGPRTFGVSQAVAMPEGRP